MTERVKLAPEDKSEIAEPISRGHLRHHRLAMPGGHVYGLNTYQTKLALVDEMQLATRPTIVISQPFSDFVERDFQQRRIDAIAEWTGYTTVGVDNPGVGLTTSNLTVADARRLARGYWDDVTDLQWQALGDVLGDAKESTPLVLSYFSLGASVAGAMAANAPQWAASNIDQVVLWDSAAPIDISFGRLAYRYARYGGAGWNDYVQENPDWMPPASDLKFLLSRITKQPLGHAVYPAAMAATSVVEHLKHAHDRGIMPHHTIINGSESRVSPTVENDELAYTLRRLAGKSAVTRVVFEDEKHAIQDSIPRTKAALPYWGF